MAKKDTRVALGNEPEWLEAYPNDGTLDYFGGRFYKQPNRKFLVRGAAANDFKNAKTLLFFGALLYAFRQELKLDQQVKLSESEAEQWQKWFKNAYLLYIVNQFALHGVVPDRGFTGASEIYKKHFSELYEGKVEGLDLSTYHNSVFPEQRQWGYLTQFWRAPLHYFRVVLAIEDCLPGEYAEACFELLSAYKGWDTFIEIIDSGILLKNKLSTIEAVMNCFELTPPEKSLAQKIILDEQNISGEEFENYRISFRLIKSLINEGREGFRPEDERQLASLITYSHVKNLSCEVQSEYWWRILVSSLMFEAGINRLYSLLRLQVDASGVLTRELINKAVTAAHREWRSENGFSGRRLGEILSEWRESHLKTIGSFDGLYARVLDYERNNDFIDGIIFGVLTSQVELPEDVQRSNAYAALTDSYHEFIPQVFFGGPIDQTIEFEKFLNNTAYRLIDEQYAFSLRRMAFGQKSKFILQKDERDGSYIFLVDDEAFYENRGIISMIEACWALWDSVDLLGA